jgi:hypothetical protein
MIIDELFEAPQMCPECGGISFSDLILAEKKDACYYKVKASAKVWPSAYASGRLVQCRKKGAANYGNKSESVAEGSEPQVGDAVYYGKRLVGWFKGYSEHGKIITEPNYEEMGDEYANRDVYWDPQDKITIKPEQGVAEEQELEEKWSQKYKSSINCANPKGFSQKAHCAGRKKNEDVAEAKPPGSRRDPLDLPPLEGPGAGGGHQVPQFTVPIIPDYVPGGANMPMAGGPKWASTRIPGVDVHTGPPPKVTVQKRGTEYEPLASEVPAYIRKGVPDPVTVPKPGTKATVKVQPGETMDQAIQRTRAEQEFSNFLKGQGGQSFGAGGGRGGQGGPTAAQATSGADQVPTIRLPGGKLSVDPDRLSPSGNYKTPATSSDLVGDKEAYNAALKIRKDQWNKMKTGKEKEGEKRRSAWKNPETDVDLEETRKKREQPEANYDDEYDAMVARVKRLAGLGPMKTKYDPAKRQYRNMPTAQQPKVQPKK